MREQASETGWVRPLHQHREPQFDEVDEQGMLTRAGALKAAQAKLGPLATISSDVPLTSTHPCSEGLKLVTSPRLVWVIGDFAATVGRGDTWEEAISRARVSKRVKDIPESAEERHTRRSFEEAP